MSYLYAACLCISVLCARGGQLTCAARCCVVQERARLAARRLEHVKLYVGNTHTLRQPQVLGLACPPARRR